MQNHQRSAMLESAADTIQVLWPKRVLMKVNSAATQAAKSSNTNSSNDRLFAECELSIVRLEPSFHSIVKRDLTPLVFSNVLPT